MNRFIEYKDYFLKSEYDKDWEVYFGYTKNISHTIEFSKKEWQQFCDKNKFPEFYKKLTYFTYKIRPFVFIKIGVL